eukprot:403339774
MEVEEQEIQQLEKQSFDIDHKRKFREVNDEFTEMIQFLDFSFEKAFDRKEKDFMLAYKAHIDLIAEDIEALKSDSNDQKYLAIKKQKIEQLESKLQKIRECALFLGDMSEMHKKQIKKFKLKVDEADSDKNFLEKQIQKSRDTNKQVKEDLSRASSEYDELYKQAQYFIQNSQDHAKIQELLALLNQSDRERLLQETQNIKQKELNEKQVLQAKIQKYGNAKLLNFMKTLWDMDLGKEHFSTEIERYFFYHSLRKSNVQKLLDDQLNMEQVHQKKIELKQEQNIQIQKQKESELYLIFQAYVNEMREDMRQRRTLNQLKNVKSIKIRTDQIDIPELTSIQISQFKALDKKRLMEKFLSDERVIMIIQNKIRQNQAQNQISQNQQHLYLSQRAQSAVTNDSYLNIQQNAQINNSNLYDRILNEPIQKLMNNRSFVVSSNRPASNYKSSRLFSGQRKDFKLQVSQGNMNILNTQGSTNLNTTANNFAPTSHYSNAPILGNIRRPITASNIGQASLQNKRRPQSSMPLGMAQIRKRGNRTFIQGAIGKEIVRHAKNDERISELALVVRKRLDEWKDEDFKCKLRVMEYENFDDMTQLETDLQGYDAFLCTLGTRSKLGEEIFKKVDYTYPVEFSKVAKKVGAIHYGLLTTVGADAKSWFMYTRLKGQAEVDVIALNFSHCSIYQPGLLVNRDNDYRLIEKVCNYIPFMPKIQSADLGRVMLEQAIQAKIKQQQQQDLQHVEILSNSDINALANEYKRVFI